MLKGRFNQIIRFFWQTLQFLRRHCVCTDRLCDLLFEALENAPLIVHKFNGQLGKISKEQRSGEWPVWETDLHNPSFSAFARLCGGHGEKVTKTEDIGPAIERALAINGPALVEIMTDAELV